MDDVISRKAAIMDAESWVAVDEYEKHLQKNVVEWLKEFPPAELGVGTDTISRQQAIDALDCINGVEEVLRSLPTIQPESSDKFIPPEQLAIKLGTATTRSAMQWIEFCNALEFLGYAIVERRVK